MFGCIGKIVVLAVLIVLCTVGYFTRGMWEPKAREKLGMKPAVSATAAAPKWEPMTVEGAERARKAIESLKRPTGPAFLNVNTGDIAAFTFAPLMTLLGAAKSSADTSADATSALAGENTLTVRGAVRLSDLGVLDLGKLGLSMNSTQRISFRGAVAVTEPGKGTFTIDRIYIGELMLTGPIARSIVRRMVPKGDSALASGALPLTLPAEIADIRITKGRVTLYKAGR
jgi:hypothetical protein